MNSSPVPPRAIRSLARLLRQALVSCLALSMLSMALSACGSSKKGTLDVSESDTAQGDTSTDIGTNDATTDLGLPDIEADGSTDVTLPDASEDALDDASDAIESDSVSPDADDDALGDIDDASSDDATTDDSGGSDATTDDSGADDSSDATVPPGTPMIEDVVSGTGIPNVELAALFNVGLSDDGKLIFVANVKGTGVTADNDHGVFSTSTGSVQPIIREGASGIKDLNGDWKSVSEIDSNLSVLPYLSGDTWFFNGADCVGTDCELAWVWGDGSALSQSIRVGDALDSVAYLSSKTALRLRLNAGSIGGIVALVEKKGGGCTDEYGCWAIFGTTKKMSAADWEFTPILHEKSALTGYKSNGKIPRIFSLTNDDRFFAVFEAVDDGSGGSNPDALAIVVKTRGVATLDHERYLDINGGFLWLAAGAGDRYAILDSTGYSGYNLKTKASYPIAAPSQVLASGTLGAANSFRFGAMSNGGHFVFTAPVDGVLSVLRHDTTKLEVLFKGGDPAPDVPNNPKTDPSGTGQYPLVNAHGYTVFWGKLDTTEPDVTAENASCLWAANAKGEVRLVIREGQPITLPGLGSKTVKTWNLGSGPWRADGLAGVLNDDDRLAVSVTFSDDSVAIVLFHLVH